MEYRFDTWHDSPLPPNERRSSLFCLETWSNTRRDLLDFPLQLCNRKSSNRSKKGRSFSALDEKAFPKTCLLLITFNWLYQIYIPFDLAITTTISVGCTRASISMNILRTTIPLLTLVRPIEYPFINSLEMSQSCRRRFYVDPRLKDKERCEWEYAVCPNSNEIDFDAIRDVISLFCLRY